MPAFHETHLDVNGVDTLVMAAGEGDPLVFFHGGGVIEGADCFLPLAERFRLVVPYHPGFGGSASDPSVTGIDGWVDHYLELFELLRIDEFTLVGHSLGGWLAAVFALDHGRRLRSLVLASPFGLDAPGHPLAHLGAVSPEEVYALLTSDPTIFADRLPVALDEEFLAARRREGQSIAQVAHGPFDPALAERLPSLTTPTLLLWGDDDRVIPIEHLPIWESAVANVESRVFPGRGHLLFWEDPDAVATTLAFVEAR